jgi:type II secretory pathway predicted ATPase ExeA
MTTKEFLIFFQFTCLPFSKEIHENDLLLGENLEKSYKMLKLLIETKGIGIMTGRPGTGKSQLVRKLIKELHPHLYKPIYICHTSVATTEFYTHICAALGLEAPGRKANMFRTIKENIEQMNKSNRIHPVLIIDEANYLCNDILKEIRLLTNFQIDSYNGLTVLLCGQEDLNARFGFKLLEALASAITINVKINPLTQDETYAYVEHRIQKAREIKEPVFTTNALKLIHEASGGNMRAINTIATGALYKAYHLKSQQVEAEHVTSVIQR